LSHAFKYA
jgi:hypothetical protein